MTRHDAPRFAADAMLGRLARWLRFLGYDTTFEAHIPDAELVRKAWRDGRVLVTRDRGIPRDWTVERVVLVEDDRPLVQLRQVVDALGLPRQGHPPARCTVCNGELRPRTAVAIAGRVPSWVAGHNAPFSECAGCGRVYWDGTHVARMRRVLDATLERDDSVPD